jgi:hypothetical protein
MTEGNLAKDDRDIEIPSSQQQHQKVNSLEDF